MYAGLLAVRRTRDLRRHRVHGLRRRRVVPGGRDARGADRARGGGRRSTASTSAYGTEVTRVEMSGGARRRGPHPRRRADRGRRRRAQPGPAGRLARPAAGRAASRDGCTAAILPVLCAAARRLDAAATATRRITRSTSVQAWRSTFRELDRRQGAADRPVAAGQHADRHRPVARTGRPVVALRAGADPEPRRRRSTGTRIGPRYRDEIVARLERLGYAGFGDSIEVESVTTPADWARRGMAHGTPFAAAHSFFQTGPFRPRNLAFDNVVFVGSGTQPGVGVPMVLISGRLAAERIVGPGVAMSRRELDAAGHHRPGAARVVRRLSADQRHDRPHLLSGDACCCRRPSGRRSTRCTASRAMPTTSSTRSTRR